MEEENTPELVRPIQQDTVSAVKPKQSLVMVLVFVFIIGAGTATGYLLSNKFGGVSKSSAGGTVSTGKEVGSTDTKTFKDTATGVLEKGGLDGEGTHKLIREGGPSQTAYLTSSVIDLDQFAGKKVQVWGETFSGQKAGWLMDIGRVKIIE
ncbi:MAG: hypothetical protein Q8Q24_02245 [bacterium]|nr:hypothetical protein [bacterium]